MEIEIPIGHKICSKCKEDKNNTDYYWYYKNNKITQVSCCKECNSYINANRKFKDGYTENQRLKRALKRETNPEFKQKQIDNSKNSSKRNRHRNLFYRAKARAMKRGLEFDLNFEDLYIPEYCPLLGVKLELGTKGNYDNTPTLDRIDNSKGYTKDNVMVISMKANSMKNSASFNELKIFCKNMLNFIQEYDIVGTKDNNESLELKDKEPLG